LFNFSPANRKRPRSPPISSNDNLSSSKETTIGACANISVGEPISISKNVGGRERVINTMSLF